MNKTSIVSYVHSKKFMSERRVILSGEGYVVDICGEGDLGFFAGEEEIRAGSVFLDEEHKRMYRVRSLVSDAVYVEECPIEPHLYHSPSPLDHGCAVANIKRNNPTIIIKRSTRRKSRREASDEARSSLL